MSTRFEKARFNVATGPASLFERVRFKMAGRRSLTMTKHAFDRAAERVVPSDIAKCFLSFSAVEWSVVSAEVRTDSGKFVNSTWEKVGRDKMRYWITIGFNDVIETVVRKPAERSQGEGLAGIVTDGLLYEYVAQVNQTLMDAERRVKPTSINPISMNDAKQACTDKPKFHGPKRLELAMSRPTWRRLTRIRQDAITVAIYTGLNLNLVEKVMSGLPSRSELRMVRHRICDVSRRGRKYCKILREVIDRHPLIEGSEFEPRSAVRNRFYSAGNLQPIDSLARVVTAKTAEGSVRIHPRKTR